MSFLDKLKVKVEEGQDSSEGIKDVEKNSRLEKI